MAGAVVLFAGGLRPNVRYPKILNSAAEGGGWPCDFGLLQSVGSSGLFIVVFGGKSSLQTLLLFSSSQIRRRR